MGVGVGLGVGVGVGFGLTCLAQSTQMVKKAKMCCAAAGAMPSSLFRKTST